MNMMIHIKKMFLPVLIFDIPINPSIPFPFSQIKINEFHVFSFINNFAFNIIFCINVTYFIFHVFVKSLWVDPDACSLNTPKFEEVMKYVVYVWC